MFGTHFLANFFLNLYFYFLLSPSTSKHSLALTSYQFYFPNVEFLHGDYQWIFLARCPADTAFYCFYVFFAWMFTALFLFSPLDPSLLNSHFNPFYWFFKFDFLDFISIIEFPVELATMIPGFYYMMYFILFLLLC